MLDDKDVERILVVTAHPDDMDFGAAGTIATWVRKGIEVSYCICTNGDAGGFDPSVPRHEIPGIRQAEQRAAAKVLGLENIYFLGYHDGKLTSSLELRCDISRVIRQVRPQRVLAQSPEVNWEFIYASHPDHRACGEATFAAVYPDSRNPFAHPELVMEGFDAWTVPEMWIMASTQPNTYVDITETFDLKIQALRAHVSQTSHMEKLEDTIKEWSKRWAKSFNLPQGPVVEAFQVVNTA